MGKNSGSELFALLPSAQAVTRLNQQCSFINRGVCLIFSTSMKRVTAQEKKPEGVACIS